MQVSSLSKKHAQLDTPHNGLKKHQQSRSMQLTNPTTPNIIKITELGQEAIANKEYFSNQNQFRNNSVHCKLRNQHYSMQGSSYTQQNFYKRRNKQGGQSHNFSKKTLRAYENWQQNQNKIRSKITKQLERNKFDKFSEYSWKENAQKYRTGINQIISKWDHNHLQQKNRIKKRLKQIYQHKYPSTQSSNIRRYQKLANFSSLKNPRA